MEPIRTFEQLQAWQEARSLLRELKQDVSAEPLKRDYRLAGQMRDCADSVMANIAEGFERGSPKEFRQFLSFAKGSCGELQSHLYSAHEFGYVSDERFTYLMGKAKSVARLIGALRVAISRRIQNR